MKVSSDEAQNKVSNIHNLLIQRPFVVTHRTKSLCSCRSFGNYPYEYSDVCCESGASDSPLTLGEATLGIVFVVASLERELGTESPASVPLLESYLHHDSVLHLEPAWCDSARSLRNQSCRGTARCRSRSCEPDRCDLFLIAADNKAEFSAAKSDASTCSSTKDIDPM